MTRLDTVREQAIRLRVPLALDSSALIAYLANEEPFARIVGQLFESDIELVLPSIAVSESLVRTARTHERELLHMILSSLEHAPSVRIIPFGTSEIVETAILRAQTRLKLPDAAIIASARLAGARAYA